MAKFKAGDTITNGNVYLTIKRVTPAAYEVEGGAMAPYVPITIIDKLWTIATQEGEIEE